MIIRRVRRPGKFTIIGNDILNCGLAADTLGVLVTLLSHPDDWSVSPVQLRRHFGKAGRPKSKDWISRVLNDLIAARFVKRRTIKDPRSHRFKGVDYIVFDEQQPTDPGSAQSDDHELVEPEPEEPTAGKPETEKPEPEKPAAVIITDIDQSPQKSPLGDGSDVSNDEQSQPVEPIGFDGFGAAWPWEKVERQDTAKRSFEKLNNEDRKAAIAGIAPYNSEAKRIGRKTVHASTYLRSKLWENFSDEPSPPKERDQVFIPVDSPLWKGCSARWQKENRKAVEPPKIEGEGGKFGWWFPTQWPETKVADATPTTADERSVA